MRCSVVFGVTLRLLVINTSSSSPAIKKLHRLLVSQLAGAWSGSGVLITRGRSQRWQHAVKPDIGSESRFLSTPPAFDAPVKRVPVVILPCRLVRKTTRRLLKSIPKETWIFSETVGYFCITFSAIMEDVVFSSKMFFYCLLRFQTS